MNLPPDLLTRLDVAIQAAHAAGEILREGFHSGVIACDTKSNRNDLVTEFDLRADRLIVDMIRHHFPTDGVLTEERGILLIEEAGGQSTDYQEQHFAGATSGIVASNGHLHNSIRSYVGEGGDGER